MARGEGQGAEEGLAALASGRRSLLGSKNRPSKGSPGKQGPSLKDEMRPAREGSERQGPWQGDQLAAEGVQEMQGEGWAQDGQWRQRALGAVRADGGLWVVASQSQPRTGPQSGRESKERRAVCLLGVWVSGQACGSRG